MRPSRARRSRITTLAVAASLGLTATASAAEAPQLLPERHRALSASGTATDCLRQRTGAGVSRSAFVAPAEGHLSAHLTAAGDWDLALFDERTGTRLAASQAFRGNEVVQGWARAGQRLVLQGCRIGARAARTADLALEYAVTPWPRAKGPVQVVKIPLTDSRRQVPTLLSLGFDVEEAVTSTWAKATIEDPAQLTKLTRAGFEYEVEETDLIGSWQQTLRADRAKARRGLRAAGPGLPSGRTEYRVYEDYQSDLKEVVDQHPGLVKAITLPHQTFQGRDVTGVEISSNVEATDDQKPTSFIMGVHHAREWPAGETVMELALHLSDRYGKDERVTKLLDTTRVVIVPIINPDGYIVSRQALVSPADDTGNPTGLLSTVEGVLVPFGGNLAYRRKNCNGFIPSAAIPCELQVGIDPNRNYGFKWGGPGASNSPNSQSFRGSGPWSEAETQNVHELSQNRSVNSLMTVHTIAALVLRPPGLKVDGQAPDEQALKELGDLMGQDTGYTSQYSFQLYDTSGTTEDWNYGAAGTFGYTIEQGPVDGEFHGPYQEYVIDEWNGVGKRAGRGLRSAFLRLAEKATDRKQFSLLRGRAPVGRTLRLKKTFQTSTSPVCVVAGPVDVRNDAYACVGTTDPILVDDKLEYVTKVGQSGSFEWLVTPSTRPFEAKAGKTETFTLTCEDGTGKVLEQKELSYGRGQTVDLELPCGGELVRPGAGAAADEAAPQSRFLKGRRLRASRRGVFLNGTAKDVAPRGVPARIAKVQVAVARRSGARCRFLGAGGSLGRAVPCTKPSFLTAKGTSRWSFTARKRRLPAGSYVAWVRAVDAAGNVERASASRNRVAFRIR